VFAAKLCFVEEQALAVLCVNGLLGSADMGHVVVEVSPLPRFVLRTRTRWEWHVHT